MVQGCRLRVQDDAPHLQLHQQLVVPPKVLADTRGRVVPLLEGATHQPADDCRLAGAGLAEQTQLADIWLLARVPRLRKGPWHRADDLLVQLPLFEALGLGRLRLACLGPRLSGEALPVVSRGSQGEADLKDRLLRPIACHLHLVAGKLVSGYNSTLDTLRSCVRFLVDHGDCVTELRHGARWRLTGDAACTCKYGSERQGRQTGTDNKRTEECHPVGAFHAMPAVGCVRCGGKGCEDDKSFVWDYNQEAARKFQECHASPPANNVS